MSTAGTADESGDSVRGPLENPTIEGIPDDPLLEPHPAEPGEWLDEHWNLGSPLNSYIRFGG